MSELERGQRLAQEAVRTREFYRVKWAEATAARQDALIAAREFRYYLNGDRRQGQGPRDLDGDRRQGGRDRGGRDRGGRDLNNRNERYVGK